MVPVEHSTLTVSCRTPPGRGRDCSESSTSAVYRNQPGTGPAELELSGGHRIARSRALSLPPTAYPRDGIIERIGAAHSSRDAGDF